MSLNGREIELKLEVGATDVARVKHRLRQLAHTKPVVKTLVSIYFDTPDWTLREHGLSLRVRRAGHAFTQTVKSAGDRSVGLYDRGEWEHPTRGPQPELRWTRKTPLGPLMRGRPAKSLLPMFETRFRRTAYQLTSAAAVIAATLDQGSARARSRRCSICEVELELLDGRTDELFRVAKALGSIVPLHLATKSKADRGYELLSGKGNMPPPPLKVRLEESATAGSAFQTVARACLQQLLSNKTSALVGDREALHHMRIALRRLRAAISVFSRVVTDGQTPRIKSGLRWIAHQLGPARDVDVFIADVLDPLRDHGRRDRGVSRLRRAFERRRTTAYAQVASSVRSRRFRRLELELAQWIEAGRWLTNQSVSATRRRGEAVTPLIVRALARRRRKLRKAGRRLTRLSRRRRHKLRVRAKKLRYIVEFSAGLFPGKKHAKRYAAILSALEALQDSLGALNDLARRGAVSHGVSVVQSEAARLTGSGLAPNPIASLVNPVAQQERVDQLLAEAVIAYRHFCTRKPFWE